MPWQEVEDAVAGDLSHGREVTICGGGVGRRTEHDGAVRELRDQPQDRLQVAGALCRAGARRSVRSATGAASGAVGDLRGTGWRDPRPAPRASELGAREAAGQALAARGGAGLAGREHDRRVAAAPGAEPEAQTA